MPVIAVVGANWGDEGKGKVTDFLAGDADLVVRYQGGNNAGHTIINEHGKFALHLLPSGVFSRRAVNVLGPGVAVNVTAFLSEMDSLAERGVPRPDVRISERAQALLLQPERLADAALDAVAHHRARRVLARDQHAEAGVAAVASYDIDRVTVEAAPGAVPQQGFELGLLRKPPRSAQPEALVRRG